MTLREEEAMLVQMLLLQCSVSEVVQNQERLKSQRRCCRVQRYEHEDEGDLCVQPTRLTDLRP